MGLSFATPLALIALITLPALWLLLRATPPAPLRAVFPPLRLLRDLRDSEETPDSAPLWLRLLRLGIATLIILALCAPLWSPKGTVTGDGPVLLIVDNGWASAPDWPHIQKTALGLAGASAQSTALAFTAPDGQGRENIRFTTLAALRQTLGNQGAQAWPPVRMDTLAQIKAVKEAGGLPENVQILWLSDGLDHGQAQAFMAGLAKLGPVQVYTPGGGATPLLIAPPRPGAHGLEVSLQSLPAETTRTTPVQAIDEDGSVMARIELEFAPGETFARGEIILPLQLRNRLKLLQVRSAPSAGTSWVFDGGWARPLVGLVTPGGDVDRQPLLSGFYYLTKALGPHAEIMRGELDTLLVENPAVLVVTDPAQPTQAGLQKLDEYVKGGGLLIRFAGPHLAASADELVPVNLRSGGRLMGGAFGWETPQSLAPFTQESPFYGLESGTDAAVRRQVLALPDSTLNQRVWARLMDGTPLVSAAPRGAGRIVLFHITAAPDWSDLPLSGLFAAMLERTLAYAKGRSGAQSTVQNGNWVLDEALSAQGVLKAPQGAAPFLPADVDIASLAANAQHPPGLYRNGALSRALNLGNTIQSLKPLPTPPVGVRLVSDDAALSVALKAPLLIFVLMLLGVDIIAGLWLSGRFRRLRQLWPGGAGTAALVMIVLNGPLPGSHAHAQENLEETLRGAQATHLAYILTGDSRVDEMSRAGLFGLSLTLKQRTTVEPADPVGVNPSKDDLSVYSLVYWPVLRPPTLTQSAIKELDAYLKNGGMLVIDTQDDGLRARAAGGVDPALGVIFSQISVPPLRPTDAGHVLTRTYYLIHDFVGRTNGGRLWVEADDAGSSLDGVSGIIAGSNDWAAAWAMSENGQPLAALSDEIPRQREMARRFGINLVMYSLTGNYKADQVHIPALLERLGEQ